MTVKELNGRRADAKALTKNFIHKVPADYKNRKTVRGFLLHDDKKYLARDRANEWAQMQKRNESK